MTKHLLAILLMLAFYSSGNAQTCTPDPNITAPGLYPDTTDNLPMGYEGIYYEEHIQVNTIKDTVLSVGKVKVDYGEMTSISGLPPGITYVCNPGTCRVNGGMKGCILFYGTCNTAGVYDITFTIKMSGKLWGTIPFTQNQIVNGYRIVINGKPNPSFYSNIQTICPGGTVKFYETATGAPTTWTWKFPGGDPSSSTAKKPFIKYYQPGQYDVFLEVTSPAGTNSITQTQYVTVGGVLAAITVNGKDSICPGGATDLEANSGNNLSYQWRKASVDIPGAVNQFYTATAGGSYSVRITDNKYACIDESPKTKIVMAYPVATIAALDPVNFCAGSTCKMKATNIAGQTYQWYRKGILIPGATSPAYIATLGGNYKCFVTNTVGCTAYSNALTLAIVCREGADANTFSVSPNPAVNTIDLQAKLSNDEQLTLEVFDATGKLISDFGTYDFMAGSQKTQLPIDKLADGIYVLKINSTTYQKSIRFAVQKNQ